MKNREFYMPGVLIAGLVGIIPGILGDCCCLCGVLTAGIGFFAVHLVRKKSGGAPIELGEGTLIGLIAGGITAFSGILLNVALRLSLPSLVSQLQGQLGANPPQALEIGGGALGIVVSSGIALVLHAGFGALGGVLAVPILKTGADHGAHPGHIPPMGPG